MQVGLALNRCRFGRSRTVDESCVSRVDRLAVRNLEQPKRRAAEKKTGGGSGRFGDASAHAKYRHGTAESVGGEERIFSGCDLEPNLLFGVFRDRQGSIVVFNVNDASDELAVEGQYQFVGGELNLNGKAQFLAGGGIHAIDEFDGGEKFLAFNIPT